MGSRKKLDHQPASTKIGAFIPFELAERVRDAAWYLRYGVSDFLREALERHLKSLEKKHGKIKPRPMGQSIRRGRKAR